MKPAILIERLILVGHRKNYITPFNPGVNIIYGDADTGKSSILELINYLLGSKKLNLYEEIESSVKYAALELRLNGKRICVVRNIFTPGSLIDVYHGGFGEIEDLSPEKYHPNFKGADDAYPPYSDFLLESLNLPRIMTKVSPSKADSSMARFSFRDLFKYCYVDQDDLGSKRFLDIGNYPVEAKNRQTFKYIFNVLDSQITEIEEEISAITKEMLKDQQGLSVLSKFLKDFGLENLNI